MKRVLRQTKADRIAELEDVLITVMEHCEGKGWRSDHVAALIRKTLRCKYCRKFYTNFRCNCRDVRVLIFCQSKRRNCVCCRTAGHKGKCFCPVCGGNWRKRTKGKAS